MTLKLGLSNGGCVSGLFLAAATSNESGIASTFADTLEGFLGCMIFTLSGTLHSGFASVAVQINSTYVLTHYTSVYENPEQYYTTRIHLGNMAHFSLRQIENYVANQLYLKGTSINRGIIV